MRVVYLGFLKTGSRSICSYVKSLLEYEIYIGEVTSLTHKDIYLKDYFTIDPLNMKNAFFNGYVDDSVVYDVLMNNENFISREFPYFGMYKYIYENYENSKFILCIRDTEDVFNSYKTYMSARLSYSVNDVLLNIYGPVTDEHKEEFIRVYEKHNADILDFFKDKPDKLLVLQFEDIGTEDFKQQIQGFLGTYDDKLEMKNLKTPNETI